MIRPIPVAACLALLLCSAHPTLSQDATEEESAGDPSYVIGVEDVLSVVTWGEPELSMSVKVRPDGRITLPLVNEVRVAGATPGEVRERIISVMGQYIRDPNVTVIVEEINNFRVFFLGEINTQGPLQFYRPTRLLQAISTAGGLTEFSSKKITILREEFGVEKRIEVDYKKLWSGDPGQENVYVKPGDTILVK
ncbi:MAG TPA: polysaccharide biosynthesis/export family protein [Candidatus Polarisedimenticolaceae bacterium]|nr:polysaccharide biosynthesis/export family protein [Candidatus Polarisedimenticolaceae bacterium]